MDSMELWQCGYNAAAKEKFAEELREHYNNGFDAGSHKALRTIVAHIKERAKDLWFDNRDTQAATLRSVIKEIENL